MKKITCLLAALLLTCSLSWAQTIDVLNHDVIGVSGTSYQVWSGITSNSDAVYAGNTAGGNEAIQMRSNNNNSGIVTTASGGMVTNITVAWNSNTSDGRTLNVYGKNAAYSAATDLYGNYAGTLIGTIVKGTSNELVIDDEYAFIGVRSANGALWLDEIQITWTEGSGVTPPSITASNVEIAYDATEGAIEYTITNPADDGVLSATTEAEWLTIGTVGETVPFTCTVNEDGAAREGVVTLVYTYGDQAINQNVTVTQAGNPDALDNISDITATGAYAVQGTIVAKSQRGFIVGDGTGYVYYYNQNYSQSDYNIGDMVKLSGSVVKYGGVYEFNNSTTITAATSSNYVEEEPTAITGEEMDTRVGNNEPAQLSNYVQYEGTLSINNNHYNITNIEGATTAIGSISYPLDTEFTTLNGKQVVVKGYYVGNSSSTYYNTMLGTIEEIEVTEPTITVTPATVNATAEGVEGTLEVAYLNVTSADAEVYFCDADAMPATYDWIDAEIDDEYNVYYVVDANEGEARTAYLMVFVGEIASNIVTINQEAYVAPALDYATLPFQFNGGRDDIEGTDGLTADGLGTDYNATSNPTTRLKFDGTGDWMLLHFNEAPGTLLFDIKGNSFNGGTFTVQTSEDGETYEDLASYTELGAAETKTFNNLDENVRYIKWIYTEKSQGNVGLGNIYLYEFGGGPAPVASITVAPATVNASADGEEGTLTVTYENITEIMAEVYFCDAEGEEATYDWIDAEIDEENNVYYFADANTGEARTAYLKVYALDDNGEDVYSNLVTINQAEYVAPGEETTYYLTSWIESGRHYIITNGVGKAMGGQNNNNRAAVDAVIDLEEGTATVSDADVCEVVINGPDVNGYYTIYEASVPGYLYAASSSSNYLRTREFNTDANSLWTITFDANGAATIKAQGSNTRNWMRYNSGNDIFSCYASGQQDVYIFMAFDFESDTQEYDFYTDIKGYGEGDGNWYLLAAPFAEMDPAEVNNMTENNFDLFKFVQSNSGEEWYNYNPNVFTLISGEGYLYANSNDVTLRFSAEPDYYTSGEVELSMTEGADFAGWNLVGNPFCNPATLDREFYVMKEDGTELELAQRSMINPFEGVFVEAQFDGDVVYFEEVFEIPEEPEMESKVDIQVNDAYGHTDFARIRFGEGNGLRKFMLNSNNTKIYFPMEDADYAVVYTDMMGEMPLNFSAAADGTYTLSFENSEMEYLHLIDNMTGTDVDLLANPSYSFNARVNDNAARFMLVFAGLTGVAENNADQFAFFSNGNLIVSNEGEATLQVVDLTGRIVTSENISGTCSVNVNAVPGVYMLRLINGDNVKTQKMIVK